MPKFHEIKLLTGLGYSLLLIFTIISYFGGSVLPMGLAIIPVPLLIELIISIYYIKISIENKRIHFLCFSIVICIIAVFIGIKVDNYKTENAKEYLLNMGKTIEEYKINNNTDYFTENDIENLNLPETVQIELKQNNFRLFYMDYVYDSEIKNIYIRPRP